MREEGKVYAILFLAKPTATATKRTTEIEAAAATTALLQQPRNRRNAH